jgi:membrane fusion protein, multidrug efflux system
MQQTQRREGMIPRSLEKNEDQQQEPVPGKPEKGRKLFPVFLVGTVVCVTIAGVVHQLGSSRPENTQPAVQSIAEMTVSVVHPEKVGAVTLEVPGYTSAFIEAPIYAQTSGYLKKWYFDIGGKVKANDLLAEIDTPEVDQELAQAKAQLQVAQSAAQLGQVTYQRDETLFDQKVLDAQTRDTAADTYREDQATVAADEANIDRLNALEAFKLL